MWEITAGAGLSYDFFNPSMCDHLIQNDVVREYRRHLDNQLLSGRPLLDNVEIQYMQAESYDGVAADGLVV